MGRLIRYKKPF